MTAWCPALLSEEEEGGECRGSRAGSKSPPASGQDRWEEKDGPREDTVQRSWPSSICDLPSSHSPRSGYWPTGVHLAHLGTHGELQAGKSPCSTQFSSPFNTLWLLSSTSSQSCSTTQGTQLSYEEKTPTGLWSLEIQLQKSLMTSEPNMYLGP